MRLKMCQIGKIFLNSFFLLLKSNSVHQNSLLIALEASIPNLIEFQPICSYLNEEIIGEFQLKNTKLKDLGLTGGRAIIRFSYRSIDKQKFESICEEFQLKLKKKLDLEEKFQEALQKQNQEQESVSQVEIVNEVKIVEPEKSNVIEPNSAKKIKNVSKSIISTQSMEIDEPGSSSFSDKPLVNNEFANFKVYLFLTISKVF